MRRSVSARSTATLAMLLSAALLAIVTIPLAAQPTAESHAQHGFGLGYDKAHEITVNGSIQRVVPSSTPGVPAGLHLLVAGSNGLVDAHLGPYLTKELQAGFQAGAAVRIVGAMQTVRGKNYLLARQVSIDGRTIVVRSENGFLLHQLRPGSVPLKSAKVPLAERNGGAQ